MGKESGLASKGAGTRAGGEMAEQGAGLRTILPALDHQLLRLAHKFQHGCGGPLQTTLANAKKVRRDKEVAVTPPAAA